MYSAALATRQIKRLFGVTLAVAFCLAPLKAFSAKEKAWPKRDFLPPVATINTKLETNPEALKTSDGEVEEVAFQAVDTQAVIRLKPKVERLAGSVVGKAQSEHLQTMLELQKKVDEADLEYLWQATVEKNPVIRFSLEKLATPADLESKQSSKFLSKTLSTLISGASLASTMLPIPGGNSAYQNMGTMAAGQALQNMLVGRTRPTVGSLSATEQIQLAGLIDELKAKLIRSYQDYKNTLENLARCHEITVKNNALYSKALASKNDMAMMATGVAYYQALLNETALRQKAKLHRLELERLAGPEAVSRLELAVHIDNSIQTASAHPPAKALATPVRTDVLDAEDLPYTIPDPIGPQPLIGPEPKSKKSAMPDMPEVMELLPSFKRDNRLPSPMPQTSVGLNKKTLAVSKSKTSQDALEPIEVLSP
jgi:hypothetical protein